MDGFIMSSEKTASKVLSVSSLTKLITAVGSVCHCQTQVVQHYSCPPKPRAAPRLYLFPSLKECVTLGPKNRVSNSLISHYLQTK
jgi:hypothetical protein